MERKPQSKLAGLAAALEPCLAQVNFYRFCQLLEQSQPAPFLLGENHSPRDEPVRFRPHPGMGFPVGELKSLSLAEPDNPAAACTVRTTFMGLYGVMSPLPTTYIDYIAQREEGSEPLAEFLDIFNHRLITQFYRIWRKYSYPATFESGGADRTSRYLLGLVGLGIDGCDTYIGVPASRFLALLGCMRLPTRTAEGIAALVRLVGPKTAVKVIPHDKRNIPLASAIRISAKHPVCLSNRPVLGSKATDVNSQVLIRLTTTDVAEAEGWLPHGQLYSDLQALLHVYLGARLLARLELEVPRNLLPDARLQAVDEGAVRLGQTAVLRQLELQQPVAGRQRMIRVQLGRYQALADKIDNQESVEHGNYKFC